MGGFAALRNGVAADHDPAERVNDHGVCEAERTDVERRLPIRVEGSVQVTVGSQPHNSEAAPGAAKFVAGSHDSALVVKQNVVGAGSASERDLAPPIARKRPVESPIRKKACEKEPFPATAARANRAGDDYPPRESMATPSAMFLKGK